MKTLATARAIKITEDRSIDPALQQKGCHVTQAEGDADVDIVKAAVSMCEYKSTTLIGEDTDLLILLLHHATLKDSHELHFRSDETGDKTKQCIYVQHQCSETDIR